MAQQTAVEWLIDWIGKNQYFIGDDLLQAFEQAKAMEKQQIANAWDEACNHYIYRNGDLVKVWADFDKYYNETYGSNNQI